MDYTSRKYWNCVMNASLCKFLILRAVCEELMLELMYRLPDQPPGGKYVVTEAVVEGRQHLFDVKPERRRESA